MLKTWKNSCAFFDAISLISECHFILNPSLSSPKRITQRSFSIKTKKASEVLLPKTTVHRALWNTLYSFSQLICLLNGSILDFDYLCSKFNRSILWGRWFRSHWKKILINVIFEMSMAALEWAQKSYTVCVLPQQPTTLQVMRSVRKKWVQAWGFVKTKDWAFFSICVLLHFENLTRILYII